ncbi:MAG: BglG family transcription antiterminator [Eubacteriaceae bacterium]|jgi:lichenan operon transcriptional antiterminator
MYLLERQIQLLDYLKREDRFVKGSELSRLLGVTDRTVRSDIQVIKDVIGTESIEAVRTKGYRYRESHNHDNLISFDLDISDPESRIIAILKQLILSREPVDIFDLAEELYVSERTIEADIQRIRRILKSLNFDEIELRRTDNYAELMNVFSTSSNLLYDVAKYYLADLEYVDFQRFFTNIHLEYLGEFTIPILNKHHYNSRYLSTTRFVLDIALMIEAIYSYDFHLGDRYQELIRESEIEPEYQNIASEIKEALEEYLHIYLNDHDQNYLAYILSIKGKMALLEQQIQCEDIHADPFYDFFYQLIALLRNKKGISFIDDEDLIKNLILHLRVAMKRSELGIKLYNPFIDNFASEYLYLIDLADFIAEKIELAYGVKLDYNEISYIGVYLALALNNRCQELSEKSRLRIFLYIPEGAGILQTIQSQIEKDCTDQKITIEGSPTLRNTLETGNLLLDYDLVITTSRRMNSDLKDVCLIKRSFDQGERKRVAQLIRTKTDELEQKKLKKIFSDYCTPDLYIQDLEADSQDEVIRALSDLLERNGYVENGFAQYVREREAIAPTELKTGLALPHSIRNTAKKSGMAVAVLKKPVTWNRYKVRMVCMYAHSVNNSDRNHLFTKCFINAVDNEKFVDEAKKSRNYEDFKTAACKYFRP